MHDSPRLGTTFGFLALIASMGLAQSLDTPPPFGERIEVELVNVEALVTDRDGLPVTDLRPEDFRVFEDGQEVSITHFSRFGSNPQGADGTGEGAATPSAEAVTVPPLHLAIFLDDVHVGPLGRRVAMTQLYQELVQDLRPEDRVLVAIYDGTVHIALPFTTDREALRETLAAASQITVAGLLVRQERRFAIDQVYQDATGADGCLHMDSIITNASEIEFAQLHQARRALGAFVDSLRGIEGRKAVLHVSDGIPMRAGSEIADYAYEMCSGTGMAQGQPGAWNVQFDDGEVDRFRPDTAALNSSHYDMTSEWSELTARANAGNVSIYTFQVDQPEGVQLNSAEDALSSTSIATKMSRSAGLQDTLFLLAEDTGGRASLHGGDLGPDLAEGLTDLRNYYLLSYTPPAGARDGVRKIRVEVTRPGLEVRHRKAYQPRSPDEQIAEQLLARLLYETPGAPSPLALEVAERSGEPEQETVRLRLRVPFASLALVPQGETSQGLLTVFLAVGERGGASSPVRQKTLPVNVATSEASEGELVWEVEVVLGTKRNAVALALRDELSGQTSFLVQQI